MGEVKMDPVDARTNSPKLPGTHRRFTGSMDGTWDPWTVHDGWTILTMIVRRAYVLKRSDWPFKKIVTAILFNGLFFYVGVLPGTPFSNTYYTTVIDSAAYLVTFAVINRSVIQNVTWDTCQVNFCPLS